MDQPALRRYSYDEYLAIEEETGIRHEYLDGGVFAMPGGTPAHSRLCVRTLTALENRLGKLPCQTFQSDLKVHIPESGLYTYPDVAIVCGGLELAPGDRNAVTNPVVLCEVLSPKTELYDRTEKFDSYARLSSLRDYVLIASDRISVWHFSRNPDGNWTLHRLGAGGQLALSVHGVVIPVDEIYEGVTLAERVVRG